MDFEEGRSKPHAREAGPSHAFFGEAKVPGANGGYRALGPDELPHLQDLEGSLKEIFPIIFNVLRSIPRVSDAVANSVAIQRALGEIRKDSLDTYGLLSGARTWRISLRNPLFVKSLSAGDAVEINWSLLLDPDPHTIELALSKLILPHQADRLQFTFRNALSPDRRRETPQIVTEGWEECIALLRDVQRIRALSDEDRERLFGFIERNENVEQPLVLRCLGECLEHTDEYEKRVSAVCSFVASAEAYDYSDIPSTDLPRRPSFEELRMGVSDFAPRVERKMGGIIKRELHDAGDELRAQIAEAEDTGELIRILDAAENLRTEEGIQIGGTEASLLPNSAVEWLARVIEFGREYGLLPHETAELTALIREMDRLLPLANAALKDSRWADLMERTIPPYLEELVFKVPQAHLLSGLHEVQELRVFLEEGQALLEESTWPDDDQLLEMQKKVQARVRELEFQMLHPELSADTPHYVTLEMVLQTLETRPSWEDEELRALLRDSIFLGRNGDIEKVSNIEEESIPLTRKEWVQYVIERGHIRRISHLSVDEVYTILDLQKIMLPLSAMAKLYIQCWDHYATTVYDDVQVEHYGPDPRHPLRHNSDILSDMQQSSFSYDVEQMKMSAVNSLRFLSGDGQLGASARHGPDLLSPRIACNTDSCPGALLIHEGSEDAILANDLEDPQCAKIWDAITVFRSVLSDCLEDKCKDLEQYPEVYDLLLQLAQKERDAGRLG